MSFTDPAPQEVKNILNLVNVHLKWRSLNGPPRGYEVYHPSAFGQCLRKMQYQRYAERGYFEFKEEAHQPRVLRIFDTGHTMHDRWARYMTEIGILRGLWRCASETCGTLHGEEEKLGVFQPEKCKSCGGAIFIYEEIGLYDKELNFSGHVDQILDFSKLDLNRYSDGNPVKVLFKPDELPKTPIVVDMKTIANYKFKSLNEKSNLHYTIQIMIYCYMLDVEYGVIIYENKDNSDVKYFKIYKNDEWWKWIKFQAEQMNAMVEEKKLPPPRPGSKTSQECKYCEFKSMCHGDGSKKTIWDHPNFQELRHKFYGDLL